VSIRSDSAQQKTNPKSKITQCMLGSRRKQTAHAMQETVLTTSLS